ncbi:MAG: alpha/beta hydrolase [Chloroflexota bacterium]
MMNLQTIRTPTSTIEFKFSANPCCPTLVFLHGLGANLSQFDHQHLFFANHFQIVSLNIRGHGNSSSTYPFSLVGCAQDVIELLDALSIEHFHFIGNSMGGNVGYELLKTFSHRLRSITTFGTTAELNTSKTTTNILTLIYRILPIRLIAQLASGAGQTTSSKKIIQTMMRQMNKRSLIAIVPVLACFNYLHVIENSQTPFLIIKGAKDSEINNVLGSTLTAFETRGHFTLLELDFMGHFANLDAPDTFNKSLLDFLSNVEEVSDTK